MADQQHLDLLRKGTPVWNPWQEKQGPGFRPDLSGANLSGANLSGANLSGANLSGADLKEADLKEADLSYPHLYFFSFAGLIIAARSGARLNGANLSGANLWGANLNGANLNGADLSGANLRRANFTRADLRRADLSGANLSEADLIRADLSNARVEGTIFANLDLRTVKGLETVQHSGPSTLGTDTIERSQGDLPEAFLRGAGLSDTSIAYVHSLKSHPTEYYTCFISYSSQDRDFATRLHADLQQQSVRCWFAPEDLKIGEKFWHRIDESIRLYDKLLVILSQHSVNSAWVEHEVMAALEKEKDYKKLVLIPITLDEQVMQTTLPWAADIRRSRHIGDFTAWKEHDIYQTAFTRLLRDLQAGNSPK
jgi:uncharacterized protein YjbI with pentapeptide repeats